MKFLSGSIKKLKNANRTLLMSSIDIFFDLKALAAISEIYFFNFFTRLHGKSGRSSEASILLVPVRLSVTLVCGI